MEQAHLLPAGIAAIQAAGEKRTQELVSATSCNSGLAQCKGFVCMSAYATVVVYI